MADLLYADDLFLLSKNPGELQVSLDHHRASLIMFGMLFVLTKCTITRLISSRTLFLVERNKTE